MNLVLLFESDFSDRTGLAVLEDRRFRHVVNVHRAATGTTLKVGFLNGRTGTGHIVAMDSKSLTMEVELVNDPPPPLPLNLVLALPRPKVLNRVIAAASSMGVKKIWLIHAAKVEKSYWQSPRLSDENLFAQSVLGLEQAKDTVMPEIMLKRRFKPFVEDEIPGIIGKNLALCADPSGSVPCPFNQTAPVTLAIGPEGGFIPYEIDLLIHNGFTPVHLGKRILRVETALPAVVYRLFSPDIL